MKTAYRELAFPKYKYLAIVTTILIFGGLCKPVKADFTVIPETLIIKATQGEVVTRTLMVKSDTQIEGLSVTRSDLTRNDGAAVISSTAVEAEILQPSMQNQGDLQQVIVKLDLTKIEKSGEFVGSLLISTIEDEQEVVLKLESKDAVGWPLLVLVLGVLLGVGLSVYRAESRDHDQIIVQIGHIRTRMRGDDTALIESFRRAIEAYLMIADLQLDDKRWPNAAKSVEQARLLWQKWLQYRDDWIIQSQYLRDLMEEATRQGLPESVPYGQAVFTALTDLETYAAEVETPRKLRANLVKIRQQVERYGIGRAMVDEIESLRKQLPDAERNAWKSQKAQLEQQLDSLDPTNEAVFLQWKADTTKTIAEIANIIQKHRAPQSDFESPQVGTRDLQVKLSHQPRPVPTVSQRVSSEVHVIQARWRLFAVNWLSRSLAIVMLSWAGLNQLYVGNSTFGATPFVDYLALLAWGLGAETTRSSLVKAIQDLGVLPPKE